MDAVYTSYRGKCNPSFSSSLLDEIYRSIDERDDEESTSFRENIRKKQSKFGGSKSSNSCFENHDDERRACLIQNWMANKVCEKPVVGRRSTADIERSSMRSERESVCFNSSSSSCDSSYGGAFSSSEVDSMNGVLFKPKPIRTSGYQQEEDSQQKVKHEGKFAKTKLKALKIYSDLKKVKQPVSPGGRLATFLNSLLTTGNTKKPKTSSASTAAAVSGGYAEAARSHLDRKSKSANASTCSSASSFSRSCLSNTPSSRGKLSNGMTRSVRFYPVSVIVDEDCQPCGHKSLQKEETQFAKKSIPKELKLNSSENNRHIQEAARNLLKEYQKKVECKSDSIRSNVDMKDVEDEDLSDDGKSDSSSDLFELDNFYSIGMHKYQEELPVYETTHFDTNRAIANGHFMQSS
ncbi:protein BIG GRAIN 1-like A [Lactuca sativa]|uniref:protein BIG GRAIN 1-like A n=1 Tax=Lactuca sativa TaxID=4236 RepID=UPI000CBE9CFB|nr:protein BIG GRAIN 1-like A [Lactuca sativa]